MSFTITPGELLAWSAASMVSLVLVAIAIMFVYYAVEAIRKGNAK
jgi:hypothetical protein